MGYTVFDFVLITLWTEKKTRIVKQTIFHHTILIIGFSAALYFGYFAPGTAACALFAETSSIFFCINEIIKGKNFTRLELVNQLCFFICYTVFRIGLFPYVLYLCVSYGIVFIPNLPILRGVCLMISILLFFSNTILNFYWYSIIFKKFKKVVMGGQLKPASQDEQEKELSTQSKDQKYKN